MSTNKQDHSLGFTRNGISVHVDLIRSAAAAHISRQPYLLGLVEETLRQIVLEGPRVALEHDMGRAIGYNFTIKTSETDTIFYAQLANDATFTRFTKHGKPTPTSYLTLLLAKDQHDGYELLNTWIGRLSPPRPGSPYETPESRPFWETHARVLEGQSLQLRTITKVCPY